MKPRIEVNVENLGEIRMGSPYNSCRITLNGDWIPTLPPYSWQEYTAYSDDGNLLGLVAWDIKNNEPGFRIIVIDAKKRTLKQSARFAGCCRSLRWSVSGFEFGIFGFVKPAMCRKPRE